MGDGSLKSVETWCPDGRGGDSKGKSESGLQGRYANNFQSPIRLKWRWGWGCYEM